MKVSSRSQVLGNVRRAVVKVGHSVFAELPVARIRALAAEVAQLRQNGVEVVIVTCGSIDLGMTRLDLKRRPTQMPLLQAASAVGQVTLMQTYEDAMQAHRIPVGQVLLTHEDLDDRGRFLRARHTLLSLLDYGVVPVINENDSVTIQELVDSDNDVLSARIPRLVDADLLVILTAAEGIYETSPRHGGHVIPLVEDIAALAARIGKLRGPRESQRSLSSKIRAAERAALQGVPTVVASGVRTGVLSNILDDETLGTLLMPQVLRRSRRKWIVEDLAPTGTLHVGAAARSALVEENHSLLPTVVEQTEGRFAPGDAVRVVSAGGEEFARGLIGYSTEELSRIQGRPPEDIEKLLGYRHYDEVIRRSDMVIL